MEENSTNKTTSTEKKANWFKSHMLVCIISVVVVVAAVVGIIILFIGNNGADKAKQCFENLLQALQEGDAEKIMDFIDVKGVYAWEECDEDASKFEEEYKNVSDEKAKYGEEKIRASIANSMSMLKLYEGMQITKNYIEEPEELANNLYKVKANIKMKVSGLGIDHEQDQDMILVIYNGKYVGEMSE